MVCPGNMCMATLHKGDNDIIIKIMTDHEHWYDHVPKLAGTDRREAKVSHFSESTSADRQSHP